VTSDERGDERRETSDEKSSAGTPVTRHSSRVTSSPSLFTLHASLLPRHSSLFTRHFFPVTRHSSLFTRHFFPVTRHASPVTDSDDLWALRDVSFEVQPGEVLGIIGRNGAGKSTLLKILSRITEPTSGRAIIRGRVASLLEVGTGFHPELTGRENIFLNGAILGMKKAEIARKFDEIVAFAEVERFIDTPVKRYSSGMYVRLAFAVAAHLEPEILVLDEVLAVGDASFQKKCLGKMNEVAKHGRTVLFVSHNMAAIRALCTRVLLLNRGAVLADGDASLVCGQYMDSAAVKEASRSWDNPVTAPGNDNVRLCYVRASSLQGAAIITVDTGVCLELGFVNHRAKINLACSAYFLNSDGILLFEAGNIISSNCDSVCGRYELRLEIPPHLLNSGRYYVYLLFGKDQQHVLFRTDEIISFVVEHTATGRGANMDEAAGVVRPLLKWYTRLTS
jgi:lipopolysaccharide transport system ATP-binding protein